MSNPPGPPGPILPRDSHFVSFFSFFRGHLIEVLLATATPKKYAPTASNTNGIDAMIATPGSAVGSNTENNEYDSIAVPTQNPTIVLMARDWRLSCDLSRCVRSQDSSVDDGDWYGFIGIDRFLPLTCMRATSRPDCTSANDITIGRLGSLDQRHSWHSRPATSEPPDRDRDSQDLRRIGKCL